MTNKTHSFDATTKTFYSDLFKRWGLTVETECEIFSHALSIDLVVRCHENQQRNLQDTVFAYFRELNAIEIKGYNDPLTTIDFNRIMMRAWGLGSVKFADQNGKPTALALPNKRTLTIICVTRPRKILDELQDIFNFKATEKAGIYLAKGRLDTWLIHPSELALCEQNYPLLALARGEKLKQFISLCLKEGLTDYLELILYVGSATDPETIWRKIVEVFHMKHVIHESTWPMIDSFFEEVPEAKTKLRTFRELLQEGRQEGWQEGQQQDKQNVLIRQLKLKFANVPETIIQTIQKTQDLQRLDHWLDQVIFAKTLEDIDFAKPKPLQ